MAILQASVNIDQEITARVLAVFKKHGFDSVVIIR